MMRLALLLLTLAAALPAHGQGAPPKAREVLSPLDFRGVTLDDGPLRRQLDEVKAYYLSIPNDDLLKGFRKRAGQSAPGVDLGGWYTGDVFHVFGQILSGLARLYAATGDPACRDKALALMRGWGRCIAPDGYFFYTAKPNVYHYTYDKMVGGLVDIIRYCGGGSEAAGYLRRITDWAEKHLSRARPYGADGAEWYTLSENLYRAYLATGEERYARFAQVWEYAEYWDRYARKLDIFGPGLNAKPVGAYHAYSHVNTLGGAGAAYAVTGVAHYLNTLRNAYDYLQARQCFATGGYGPNEQLLPMEGLLRLLADTHNTFETQCGSWAAFKMCKYLIRFTGDARYGDWVEKLAVNGIGASIPMSADGHVFYYSDYCTSGGAKRNTDFGWSCCTGTRPEAVADYADLVFFRDSSSLGVNLFTPATVHASWHGAAVTVRQETRFPEEEATTLTVSCDRPARLALRLRRPGWLAGPMRAELNGKPVELRTVIGHWATLDRVWRGGDRLRVSLPMGFRVSRLLATRPYPAAIMRGPVALAVRTPGRNPAKRIDLAHLERVLYASPGEPLTYQVAGDQNMLVRPFSAFKEGERYFLYLDPAASNRISHSEVTFGGNWQNSGEFRFSNVVGVTAEATFEGTGIRWLGYRFDDGGRAEVTIDGKVVATVDQYGPGRGLPFDWRHEGLPMGRHTIRLRLLPEKTEASRDRFLNVAGFQILGAQ